MFNQLIDHNLVISKTTLIEQREKKLTPAVPYALTHVNRKYAAMLPWIQRVNAAVLFLAYTLK